ncbi:MAG: hypothetical protein DESF_01495 [Desulfovibrio sp.]
MAGCRGVPFLGEPFAGYGFKSCCHLEFKCCGSCLRFLLRLGRINVFCQKLFGLFPLFTGVFQGNIRVCAKGQQLFLALKAVLEPSWFAACRGNKQKETASIKKLEGFVLRLGVANAGI